ESRVRQAVEERLFVSQAYRPSVWQELFGDKNNCVSGTAEILRRAGIDVGTPSLPAGLWQSLHELVEENPGSFLGAHDAERMSSVTEQKDNFTNGQVVHAPVPPQTSVP